MRNKKTVCAIISVYNPDLDVLSLLVNNIFSSVDMLILVDNSDDPVSLASLIKGNVFLYSQNNSGITGAMNRGIIESGYIFDYYIFLDQDSFFKPSTVTKYVSEAIKNSIDISAPMVLNYEGEKVHERFFNRNDKERESDFIILDRTQLSGLLVSKECLIRVGLFNEDYFLNLGDTEWCLRANRLGYSVMIHKNIFMYHSYAEGVNKIGPYSFYVSSPFRLYYSSRDSLRLIFSNTPYRIKLRLGLKLVVYFFEIAVSDCKVSRIKFYTKGFIDYFRGRKGIM